MQKVERLVDNCFLFSLDCTLENEAGVCLDIPYLCKQGQAGDGNIEHTNSGEKRKHTNCLGFISSP